MNLYTFGSNAHNDPKQVIFINQKNIPELDSFFARNLEEVTTLFEDYDLQFVYLPAMLTPEYVKTLLDYQAPGLTDEARAAAISRITPQAIYDEFYTEEYFDRFFDNIFGGLMPQVDVPVTRRYDSEKCSGLVWSGDTKPAPLLTECDNSNNSTWGRGMYCFYNLDASDDNNIRERLDGFFMSNFSDRYMELNSRELCLYNKSFVSHNEDFYSDEGEEPKETENGLILTSLSKNSLICYPREADEEFPEEAYKLSREIIERVEKLRKIGVNELIIRNLLIEGPKPSRLIVTKDYKLILSDYNNKEIVMRPLPKAVFLLFLKHPEGIMFKRMLEWREELLELYCRCSGREPDEEIRQSVDKLTDPLNNSLNEKCSRIREAFLREMDDSIASHYYITGDRATPKCIQLDRELVEWEEWEHKKNLEEIRKQEYIERLSAD